MLFRNETVTYIVNASFCRFVAIWFKDPKRCILLYMDSIRLTKIKNQVNFKVTVNKDHFDLAT